MSEDRIEINLLGSQEAINGLVLRAGSVRRGARLAMGGTTLRILSRVKSSFGEPGKPQRRTGHLSRSIIRIVTDEGEIITGIVGSTLPYKTGYAAILEKGGPLPAMTITAKPGKVLAWPVGVGKFAFRMRLAGGGTFKQARAAAIKASNRSRSGGYAYARSVKIPARYQRAMPYLRPGFEEERPLIEETFRNAILAQIKGQGAGGTGGES